MTKNVKKVLLGLLLLATITGTSVIFTGCEDDVYVETQRNKNAADKFQIEREIEVFYVKDGRSIYTCTGKISVDIKSNRLNIMKKVDGGYKRDIIRLTKDIGFTIKDITIDSDK